MATIDAIFSALSPREQHIFLLKQLEAYYFGFEGSALHLCEACGARDFERGGLGGTIEYNCEFPGCDAEYCNSCVKEKGVGHRNIDDDSFVCNKHR